MLCLNSRLEQGTDSSVRKCSIGCAADLLVTDWRGLIKQAEEDQAGEEAARA